MGGKSWKWTLQKFTLIAIRYKISIIFQLTAVMMTVSKHRHLCLGSESVEQLVPRLAVWPTGPATPKLDKYKTNDISTWTEFGNLEQQLAS